MPQVSSKEQFDRQAAHYDKQWNSWSEETLAWLVDAAEPKKTDTAIDIATGAGFTATALAEHAGSVTASDVSVGMLDQLRARAESLGLSNITLLEAPAEKLPLADSTFDIVTCRIAAHHFINVKAFVSESARLLKPGGRFVLVDTTVPSDDQVAADWQNEVEELRDQSHVRNYSDVEWRNLVEDAGLEIVEVITDGQGITIPLDDWLKKAGTPEPMATQVRDAFANPPASAKSIYKIQEIDGQIQFTWLRILLKAVKPR